MGNIVDLHSKVFLCKPHKETQTMTCIFGIMIVYLYTKSLVNTNLVHTNFTNKHFQKVPIPHLTRTMKQKFLH